MEVPRRREVHAKSEDHIRSKAAIVKASLRQGPWSGADNIAKVDPLLVITKAHRIEIRPFSPKARNTKISSF